MHRKHSQLSWILKMGYSVHKSPTWHSDQLNVFISNFSSGYTLKCSSTHFVEMSGSCIPV